MVLLLSRRLRVGHPATILGLVIVVVEVAVHFSRVLTYDRFGAIFTTIPIVAYLRLRAINILN